MFRTRYKLTSSPHGKALHLEIGDEHVYEDFEYHIERGSSSVASQCLLGKIVERTVDFATLRDFILYFLLHVNPLRR